MSSLLGRFARCAPRAVGGGVCASSRSARSCTVRSLSFSTVARHSTKTTSAATAALPRAAAPCATHNLQQQCRLMSMETKVADEAEVAAAPSEGGDDAVLQAQISGISFDLTLEALEASLKEAGITADARVNLLLRPASSSRAGQNKGRAFVEVDTEEDMQKVMELNGQTIDNRPVYVSRLQYPLWETRAVTVRSMRGIREEDIIEVMQREVGVAPRSVRIRENPERSTCVAYCRFESPELAEKATALDGANIMGRWLDVTLAPSFVRTPIVDSDGIDRLTPFAEPPTEGSIIMVKGLPFDLTVEDLRSFFHQSGIPDTAILQMRMPMHKADRNTGIAYVNAADDHVEALLNLKGSYINERWIDIAMWVDRSKVNTGPPQTSVAESRPEVVRELRERFPDLPVVEVGSLPFDKSQQDFTAFLEEQGVPLDAVPAIVMPLFRQTPNNMGTAWLVVNEEAAYNRVMELTGTVFHERWLTFVDA